MNINEAIKTLDAVIPSPNKKWWTMNGLRAMNLTLIFRKRLERMCK